jgi:hypothetical protein
MSYGGSNPPVSLIQDNPGVPITGVQGGGGDTGVPVLSSGWHSNPQLIPVAPPRLNASASHLSLKNYSDRWRKTLGPNIPSRRRARNVSADEHVIVGSLNIIECPTFIVAPLRGDINAAKDILHWAEALLRERPDVHVVFSGPITEGGNSEDAVMIEKMLNSLFATFPGHAVGVGAGVDLTDSGYLDGLVLHAMPHSSKEVVFGFIPAPDSVKQRSNRMLDCLEVETMRVPATSLSRHYTGERMHSIHFRKPSSIYSRDKEPRPQVIRENHIWGAPPGWVTEITYVAKRGGAPGNNRAKAAAAAKAAAKPVVVPAKVAAIEKAGAERAKAAAAAAAAAKDPKKSEVPPEIPKNPEVPPQTPPGSPETPPEVPKNPEVPPQTPPGSPEASPGSFDSPKKPETPPGSPEEPKKPEAPPEAPKKPEAPPEAPKKPEAPPEAPNKPEAPKEPESDSSYDDADGVEVVLNGKKYKVGRPEDSQSRWATGNFSKQERLLLEENDLIFENEVYAIFLKGLVDDKCEGEGSTHLSPECAAFRYLMSLTYFNGVQAHNDKTVVAKNSKKPKDTAAEEDPGAKRAAAAKAAAAAQAAAKKPEVKPAVKQTTGEARAAEATAAAKKTVQIAEEATVRQGDNDPKANKKVPTK